MKATLARLQRRVRKLEKQHAAESDPAQRVNHSIQKAVLYSLSNAELDLLEEYLQPRPDGSYAEPTVEHNAVAELYERRYQDFRATGNTLRYPVT